MVSGFGVIDWRINAGPKNYSLLSWQYKYLYSSKDNWLGLKKSCLFPVTLTSFYSKKSLPLSFFRPPNSQSTKNVH